jgi:protein gp37
MASTATSIEWTDATWNPVTGCSKVSPGCAHCYAERLAPKVFAGQIVTVATADGVAI